MTTSKDAWELAWREEFPNSAGVAHYDGVAAAKRIGFEAGYRAAVAKLSPGLAGSAALAGDTAEAPALDSPAQGSPGTSGGLGELDAMRARLEAVSQAAATALGFLPHNHPGARMAAEKLAQALADDAENSAG